MCRRREKGLKEQLQWQRSVRSRKIWPAISGEKIDRDEQSGALLGFGFLHG